MMSTVAHSFGQFKWKYEEFHQNVHQKNKDFISIQEDSWHNTLPLIQLNALLSYDVPEYSWWTANFQSPSLHQEIY